MSIKKPIGRNTIWLKMSAKAKARWFAKKTSSSIYASGVGSGGGSFPADTTNYLIVSQTGDYISTQSGQGIRI